MDGWMRTAAWMDGRVERWKGAGVDVNGWVEADWRMGAWVDKRDG